MRMTTTIAPAAALLLLCTVPALAQRGARDPQSVEDDFMDQCHDNQHRWNDDRVRFCEVRERRISAPRLLDVDGRQNGSVNVHGWDRADVLVVAKIQSEGEDPNEARDLAGGTDIQTSGGHVHAEGPSTHRRQSW